jgi:hypothetical protein
MADMCISCHAFPPFVEGMSLSGNASAPRSKPKLNGANDEQ